jgi:hypothetical protein
MTQSTSITVRTYRDPVLRVFRKLKRLDQGREMLFTLNTQLGVNRRLARRLTKLSRILLHPYNLIQRKWIAQKLHVSHKPSDDLQILNRNGYLITAVDELPFGRQTLNAATELLNQYRSGSPDRDDVSGQKTFRPNILTPEDLILNPDFLRFATSEKISKVISNYLGTLPIVGEINLWVSYENNSLQQSQLFHIDQEDFKQIKVFLNISHVATVNGPLSFFPASLASRISKSAENPLIKLTNSTIDKVCTKSELIELTGPPGTLGLVDTCRCYHMGSRTRVGQRAVLMIQYVPRHCVMAPKRAALTSDVLSQVLNGSLPSHARQMLRLP